jgi:chromate transporter
MKELLKIFITFAGIGSMTFGGGYTMLPLLKKKCAEKLGWVTDEEIMDYYAIAQCLPGVIAVNTSMLIGKKRKGGAGLISAALGMITPSVIVILVIAVFIRRFLEYQWVRNAFNGIRVAVLALIIEAVIGMWKRGVKDLAGVIIFTACLLVLTLTNITPAAPMLAGAACGILIREGSVFKKKKK